MRVQSRISACGGSVCVCVSGYKGSLYQCESCTEMSHTCTDTEWYHNL